MSTGSSFTSTFKGIAPKGKVVGIKILDGFDMGTMGNVVVCAAGKEDGQTFFRSLATV